MSQRPLISYFCNGSVPLVDALYRPYTHIILSFLTSSAQSPFTLALSGAMAAQAVPPTLTQSSLTAIRQLQAKGIKVMVAYGGATMHSRDYAAAAGQEEQLAYALAEFVRQYELDGIDIDWEDTAAFMGNGGYDGSDFLIRLTQALRQQLPAGRYQISHAPQPPYMVAGSGMDGYIKVMAEAGQAIDLVNMQFYNNPPWSGNPQQIVESYRQFAALPGVGTDKLVLGLPAAPHNAGPGSYLPASIIAQQIIAPLLAEGGIGGAMNWEFSGDADGQWGQVISQALAQTVTA
ncbi:glycoside hydrolase family 18 protein [Ferrimonas kyonanensis]|uniref:glycoside hydrolase family 18 protein n=1 Tax=Ferrimonas kyonanensis TaxID=364763 RepID=UPI00042297D1|nr:glycoside hydrolase family 18 protein [Ferrimonas kyonanensis]